MPVELPQCFLGKTVYLEEKQAYTIKYQDNRNKDGAHVLLFDGEKPVIFAIMQKDGSFRDAFFINKKTNHSSLTAMNRYNRMVDRKKQLQVKQDELKDALRSANEAKMKNENIYKLLVDEHLEDISNGWPSRLLYMQMNDFKSNDSLIMNSLKEALKKANPNKAFYFLTLHRYDNLLPELIDHLNNHPEMLDHIFNYYNTYQDEKFLFSFLKQAAKTLPLDNVQLTQIILSQIYSYDMQKNKHFFKPLFLIFYKRVKASTTVDTKGWLNQLSEHSLLKQAIRSMKKQK